MALKAFQLLPIEVNENIAFYLASDKDFANFNAICRQTRAAIQSHRCGAWRARWNQTYDMAPGRNGQMLKVEYMTRRMYLYTKGFSKGFGAAEMNCIAVLKQLIIESYSEGAGKKSKNLVQLDRFIRESNILKTLATCLERNSKATQNLQILLVCLAHWLLRDSELGPHVVSQYLPRLQVLIYLKFDELPLFKNNGVLTGAIVNTTLVLAMIYFWRYHVLSGFTEGAENPSCILECLLEPNVWKHSILQTNKKVRPLSKKWKGIHGYCPDQEILDDSFEGVNIRHVSEIECDEILMDEFDQDGVQHIEFDFNPAENHAKWTQIAEQYLQAMPSKQLCAHIREITRKQSGRRGKTPVAKCLNTTGISKSFSRGLVPKSGALDEWLSTGKLNHQKPTQHEPKNSPEDDSPQRERDYLPFSGSINRTYSSAIHGILHDLPSQSGVSGFQRISFLSFDKRKAPNPEDVALLEEWDISRNEGVVLPGGHMIIGRYWSELFADGPHGSGPFIMWEASG